MSAVPTLIRVLLSALLLATPAVSKADQAAAAPVGTATTLRVDGLRQTVEILRDRWGLNHI